MIKQCRQPLDTRNRERWKEEIHLMKTNNHRNLVAGRDIPPEVADAIKAPEALLGLEYCESDLRKVNLSFYSLALSLYSHVLSLYRHVLSLYRQLQHL